MVALKRQGGNLADQPKQKRGFFQTLLHDVQGWAHAVTVGVVGAVGLYATNSGVQSAVNTLVAGNKTATVVLAGVSAIGLALANSRKSR